jgi:hypothetical protein
MSNLVSVTLQQEKETKNMVKFVAPGTPDEQRHGTIPNLYVRKTALASAFGKFPTSIRVTVETA